MTNENSTPREYDLSNSILALENSVKLIALCKDLKSTCLFDF